MTGTVRGALVVAVTASAATVPSRWTCATPNTSAAPPTATTTDTNATIFIIEKDLITTTRRATHRQEYWTRILELMRRFCPHIKSSQKWIVGQPR
jgi:hypothetical protein